MSGAPLLRLENVTASVADFEVTHDLNLTVEQGQAIGLVGRNGAGKTTTFRSIMGLAEVNSGSIVYDGHNLTSLPAESIPKLGIGYQPEDRKLFTGMSIEKNIRMPIWTAGDARGITDEDAVVEEVFDVFEELSDIRSQEVQTLSGGQAKMTAISRALALKPDLLILDEPLEGLAPVVVENIKEHIQNIIDSGVSVLVAESNASHIPDFVDRMYVIERGEIFAEGDPHDLRQDEDVQNLMQGSGE